MEFLTVSIILIVQILLTVESETITSFTPDIPTHKDYSEAAKSKEFVNEIQQSLRRDNDDYIERASLTTKLSLTPTSSYISYLSTSPDLTTYATRHIQQASTNGNDVKRRANDQDELQIRNFDHSIIHKVATKDHIAKSSSIVGKLVTKILKNRVKNKKKKVFRKNNMNKIKKYKDQPKQNVQTTSYPFRATNNVDASNIIKISSSTTEKFDLWEFLTETAKLAYRSNAAVDREDKLTSRTPLTPDPNQFLDLAPARGGKIDILRTKGRLCQRQVLMPEGPKYDSRGRVYVASVLKRSEGRAFTTQPPRLLLPICCNCCKKSVLGCE